MTVYIHNKYPFTWEYVLYIETGPGEISGPWPGSSNEIILLGQDRFHVIIAKVHRIK